jgi:hypothetical protein
MLVVSFLVGRRGTVAFKRSDKPAFKKTAAGRTVSTVKGTHVLHRASEAGGFFDASRVDG